MEQPEQILKLNPHTGYYEGIFTVRVEAEIFQRVLFTYVEEHHINLTDVVAWEKAIHEVACTGKWLSHPRAHVEVKQETVEVESSPIKAQAEEAEKAERKTPTTTKKLSQQEKQALWEKALQLPIDQWKTLLTPLPTNLPREKKWPYYFRRSAEHHALKELKEKMEPVPMERVAVIAEAVNGTRLR